MTPFSLFSLSELIHPMELTSIISSASLEGWGEAFYHRKSILLSWTPIMLLNLISSQNSIFVAFALVTWNFIHWKPGISDSCYTQVYWTVWWLWPKYPKACWGQGKPSIWILQTKRGEYFSFPTGKYYIPPNRHRYWKCNQLSDSP